MNQFGTLSFKKEVLLEYLIYNYVNTFKAQNNLGLKAQLLLHPKNSSTQHESQDSCIHVMSKKEKL